MYGWWWRRLPGPWWLRALISLVVALAVILFCFTVVFPALADRLALNQGTVDVG